MRADALVAEVHVGPGVCYDVVHRNCELIGTGIALQSRVHCQM